MNFQFVISTKVKKLEVKKKLSSEPLKTVQEPLNKGNKIKNSTFLEKRNGSHLLFIFL
jgi:hypothetical protein